MHNLARDGREGGEIFRLSFNFMSNKYKQVVLERIEAIGHIVMTTHIPSKFAILGKEIKIKIEDEWSYGWKVVHTGSLEVEENYVNERSQDYKRTRKASDI